MNKHLNWLLLIKAIILLVSLHFNLNAQWSHMPQENNPVCTAADEQTSARMIADDAGGAIITWLDQRNGTNNNGSLLPSGIYYYRITAGNFRDVRKMMLLR